MENNIVQQILEGKTNQIFIVSAADLLEVVKNIGNTIAQEFLPKKEEKYLTTSEAARMLRVDKTTLYRWDKENYLNAVRLGAKKRYRLSDIEHLLDARGTKPWISPCQNENQRSEVFAKKMIR